MRIAIVSNTAWSLVNFRMGLMKGLLAEGHQVVAMAPPDECVNKITALGVEYKPLTLDNKGTNPARDLVSVIHLVRLFHAERIQLAFLYTIKPVIYGSLACRLLRIPAMAVITGLGTAYLVDGILTRIVETLYRISLKRVHSVFFLNDEDMSLFMKRRLVPVHLASKIPGEGVDLDFYSPRPKPGCKSQLHFLFIGRMMRDKGVFEYVEAARSIKSKNPDVHFSLLGFIGVQNQSAIDQDQMNAWVNEGVVDYLGSVSDVRQYIASADCVVLPSYREGISRALLEAIAMERAVVATDVVGCRELIEDGGNGYLCKPRDSDDLARVLEKFAALSDVQRSEMGRIGRTKVASQYDEALVIDIFLRKVNELASTETEGRGWV